MLAERRRSMERDRGGLMDAGVVANLEGDAGALRDRAGRASATISPRSSPPPPSSRSRRPRSPNAARPLSRIPTGRPPTSVAASRGGRGARRAALAAWRPSSRQCRTSPPSTAGSPNWPSASARLEAEPPTPGARSATPPRSVEAAGEEADVAEARRRGRRGRGRGRSDDRHCRRPPRPSRWQTRADALAAGPRQRPGPGRRREARVASTAWSARWSTWSRSTPAGSRPSRPPLGEALQAVVVADPVAARRCAAAPADARHDRRRPRARRRRAPRRATAPVGGEAVRPHVRSPRRRASRRCSTRCSVAPSRVAGAGTTPSTPRSPIPTPWSSPPPATASAAAGWRLGAAGSGATAAALDEAVEQLRAAELAHSAASEADRVARAALQSANAAETDVQRRLDANDAASPRRRRRSPGLRPTASAWTPSWPRPLRPTPPVDERLTRDGQRVAELEALLPALEADEAAEAEAARARCDADAESNARAALLAGRRQRPRGAQRRPPRAPAAPGAPPGGDRPPPGGRRCRPSGCRDATASESSATSAPSTASRRWWSATAR